MTHTKLKVIFIVTEPVEAHTPHGTPSAKCRNNGMVQVRKVILFQWWIKHDAMKTYERVGVIGPRILDLGAMWQWRLRKKSARSLDGWLGGLQRRSGHWRTDARWLWRIERRWSSLLLSLGWQQSRFSVIVAGSRYKFPALLLVESLLLLFQKPQFWILSSSYLHNQFLDTVSCCGYGNVIWTDPSASSPPVYFHIFHPSLLLTVLFTGILVVTLGSCSHFGLVGTPEAAGG